MLNFNRMKNASERPGKYFSPTISLSTYTKVPFWPPFQRPWSPTACCGGKRRQFRPQFDGDSELGSLCVNRRRRYALPNQKIDRRYIFQRLTTNAPSEPELLQTIKCLKRTHLRSSNWSPNPMIHNPLDSGGKRFVSLWINGEKPT